RARWAIRWDRSPNEYASIKAANDAEDDSEKIRLLEAGRSRGGWESFYADFQLGRVDRRVHPDRAWAAWERARETADALGSPTADAGRLRSLAFLDIQSERYDRAADEIEHARELSESVDDRTGVIRADYYRAFELDRRDGPVAALIAKRRYLDAIAMSR